jgi:hypothetical protein
VPFLFKSLANPTFSRLQYEAFLIVVHLYKELTDAPLRKEHHEKEITGVFLVGGFNHDHFDYWPTSSSGS